MFNKVYERLQKGQQGRSFAGMDKLHNDTAQDEWSLRVRGMCGHVRLIDMACHEINTVSYNIHCNCIKQIGYRKLCTR